MARRRREEEHENHERWLVSYADFITLLFAFFVVMYAISSVNEGKYKVLSDSLTNAFKNTTGQPGGQPIVTIQGAPLLPVKPVARPDKLPDQKRADDRKSEQRQKMKNVADDIKNALQPLIAQGKVKLLETSRGVTIEINDSILFPPGQAGLQPASINAMQAIAQVLAASDFPITIEGHTDNVPISTPQFPSNWELSANRANASRREMISGGMDENKVLRIVGLSSTVLFDKNDPLNSVNRRISIVVLNSKTEQAILLEEGPEAEAAGEEVLPEALKLPGTGKGTAG